MIITRTPCRMSFAGGGSDLPAFYRRYGGAVLSTSIANYVHVIVNPKFEEDIRVSYSKTEICSSVDEIEHPIVKASLRMLGIKNGIEVVSVADIPSKGTGLGSSSSFTVGLLNALHGYLGHRVSKAQLADESCRIELDYCGEPIGKQDQYAAAFGGFNFIRFNEDDTVDVEPLNCAGHVQKKIEARLLSFYTGITRSARRILQAQTEALEAGRKTDILKRMVQQAYELRQVLHGADVSALGEMLHEGWMLKRGITRDVSSTCIDDWYKRARGTGAVGGKLLGAGGGGFLVFYAEPDRHEAIRRALPELREVRFRFDLAGTSVVLDNSCPGKEIRRHDEISRSHV